MPNCNQKSSIECKLNTQRTHSEKYRLRETKTYILKRFIVISLNQNIKLSKKYKIIIIIAIALAVGVLHF